MENDNSIDDFLVDCSIFDLAQDTRVISLPTTQQRAQKVNFKGESQKNTNRDPISLQGHRDKVLVGKNHNFQKIFQTVLRVGICMSTAHEKRILALRLY